MPGLFCQVKVPDPPREYDPWESEVTADPGNPDIFKRPWFTHEDYLQYKQRENDV